MAERRKVKVKRREKKIDHAEEPTKEAYAIAKYLRFHCPCKKTLCFGDEVSYFAGCKAVDVLLDSKWATSRKRDPPLFTTRQSCVDYLQTLLEKDLFFRAKKLIPKRKERIEAKDTRHERKTTPLPPDSSPSAVKESDHDEKAKHEGGEKPVEGSEDAPKEVVKKPKKIRLEFHPEQVFIDGNDVYVWKYDPTPVKTFVLGLLMVVGSIAVCLFPLWPPQVRLGVYYLSVLAMGFVGLIILLVILRTVIMAVVWVTTLGRHQFWILPNLTEDVGFFDSFKPLYTHEYRPPTNNKKTQKQPVSRAGSSAENGKGNSDGRNVLTDSDRMSDEERPDKRSDVSQKSGSSERESDNSSGQMRSSSNNREEFEFVEKPVEM